MMRFSSLGFYSLFGSILVFILQAIASVTSKDLIWKPLRIVDVLDAKYYAWLNDITILNLNAFSNFILNMQLYSFLFCLTVLFFIISSIFEK